MYFELKRLKKTLLDSCTCTFIDHGLCNNIVNHNRTDEWNFFTIANFQINHLAVSLLIIKISENFCSYRKIHFRHLTIYVEPHTLKVKNEKRLC